jgi:hypothetical protein
MALMVILPFFSCRRQNRWLLDLPGGTLLRQALLSWPSSYFVGSEMKRNHTKKAISDELRLTESSKFSSARVLFYGKGRRTLNHALGVSSTELACSLLFLQENL